MVRPGGHLEKQDDKLDAQELSLGKEFQTTDCLMNAEVKFLLQAAKERKLRDDPDAEQTLPSSFQETLQYVTKINRFESAATVDQLKVVLQRATFPDSPRGLAPFEIAQLCNLSPGSVEEAKTVVPSLSTFSDQDLQKVITDVTTLQRFQA